MSSKPTPEQLERLRALYRDDAVTALSLMKEADERAIECTKAFLAGDLDKAKDHAARFQDYLDEANRILRGARSRDGKRCSHGTVRLGTKCGNT